MSHPLSTTRTLTALAVALGLAASTMACAAKHQTAATDEDTALLAQDGADTSATENDTETLSTSFVASSSATLTLASEGELNGSPLQLSDVGDAVKASYAPAGCVTVTNDAANKTVTYDFKGCTGPYGLRNVTGTVTLTWSSPAVNKLVLDFSGSNLHVNKATADWSAHAEITAGLLGKRTMTWKAQLSGTTARGRDFTRTNTKTIQWTVGQDCVLVNGASDGNVKGRGVHTDVIGYSRCKGECPAAGSEIRITSTQTGKSIDIVYNGGPDATFTGPNGGQVDVPLACGL